MMEVKKELNETQNAISIISSKYNMNFNNVYNLFRDQRDIKLK